MKSSMLQVKKDYLGGAEVDLSNIDLSQKAMEVSEKVSEKARANWNMALKACSNPAMYLAKEDSRSAKEVAADYTQYIRAKIAATSSKKEA